MQTEEKKIRPIRLDNNRRQVQVIDQRQLPHRFVMLNLATVDDLIDAVRKMVVRGAPLIGVAGAYGVYLAVLNGTRPAGLNAYLIREAERIKAARPTAVNLAWAVDRVLAGVLSAESPDQQLAIAQQEALRIEQEEVARCHAIGQHGAALIEAASLGKTGQTVHILTHCNAGWLACIDYGTATAPIYVAHERRIDVHVWVDETRPLNQGARLTAWELGQRGVPHTVITDNAGGHLMQHGLVDLVIVGTDRTTATGDVANKIGTYLKALAAKDNGVPFYVALPSSSIDWTLTDGVKQIAIEERDADEVRYVQGLNQGRIQSVLIPPAESPAVNFAFDVTPARLVTGFITENGVCRAEADDIRRLFPNRETAENA